jgi:AraC family transcriptional regulator
VEESSVIDQAELKRQEYVGRVNRVIDHIRENLAGDLCLETLARVANFSPYHFHRVFRSIAGETLNDFIRRVRVQRAASQLIHNPTRTITEIAVNCGYSSPSAFAREFRRTFDMSASQFRKGGNDSLVRFRERLEERGAEFTNPPDLHFTRTDMVLRVDVRALPELYVAYVRHVGRYNEIGAAFKRLMRWAGPRRLLRFPETKVLAIYHDNPDVTPVDQLRAEACVTVPEGTRTKRDIGTMTVPGGLFAVAYVEIDPTQYGEAWDRLIGEWMPQSGYQPDDRMCYELYLNDPEKHPEGKHIVEICEPIRPL